MFKQSKADITFYFLVDLLLFICLLVVAYPLIYIISSSFSSTLAVTSGQVWLLPVDFSLEGYKAVFRNDKILSGYGNTIIYTFVGTAFNIVMTVLAAYPLSRKVMPGKKIITLYFMFTMLFSGGMIPNYLLMNKLNWLNTLWVMVIPNAIGIWNLMITKTFYENNISEELFEAAQLDGCTHVRFLTSIVLPLSKAITAVLLLFYAVGHWNSFFDALIYLSDQKKYPLQIVLREILILNTIDVNMVYDPVEMANKIGLSELLKYSLIIVASLPVWCVYPFVQRHFVKGVMLGAIKG